MNGGDLLQYEFKADIEKYLAEWAPGAAVRNLADLIAFNTREAARELTYFGQETFEGLRAPRPADESGVRAAQGATAARRAREGIDTFMDDETVSRAIVAVSGSPRAAHRPGVRRFGRGRGAGRAAPALAATAGYPHITVPMGFIRGPAVRPVVSSGAPWRRVGR